MSDGPELPATHFAEARGARLAYQVFGEGEHRVIAIPPLAQNIEAAWGWPSLKEMLDRFGSFSRFVHFDKRGTGASDHRSAVPGLDERVDDVRAVMDAVDFPDAHLFVQSDGGPMAILFAVTYPHRVNSITLFGSYAYFERNRTKEERIAARERQVRGWGTPESLMVDFFAPSLASNAGFRSWWESYERKAASRDSLRDLLDLTTSIDVRDVLGDVSVPTLVLHRRGDRIVPLEMGRQLAESIPGAQMIEYDSPDHFAFVGSLDWIDDFERFVTGAVQPHEAATRPTKPLVKTLGGFSVEVDGRPVETSEWGSRHARQICKRLVAARGWPVTRDDLIHMMWPDENDRGRLGARLSVQLSALRRVLGGGVIANRETVALDLSEVDTDLEALHAAPTPQAVVAAYSGEFLPEDRYDDWTYATRDEARNMFVAAAREAAASAVTMGRHDMAIPLTHRMIAADKFDTNAHELLIRSLYASGQLSAAHEGYTALKSVAHELEIEPPTFDEVVDS